MKKSITHSLLALSTLALTISSLAASKCANAGSWVVAYTYSGTNWSYPNGSQSFGPIFQQGGQAYTTGRLDLDNGTANIPITLNCTPTLYWIPANNDLPPTRISVKETIFADWYCASNDYSHNPMSGSINVGRGLTPMALDYNDYDEYNDSPAASVTQLLSPDGYGYNVQYISTTLGNGVIQGTSTHYSATATLPPFNANLQYGGVDIYHTMHGFGQIVYSASVVN